MKKNKKKYFSPSIIIKEVELEHGFLVGSKSVQITGEVREQWTETEITAEFDWDAWWNN